jgi:hypothetical protein
LKKELVVGALACAVSKFFEAAGMCEAKLMGDEEVGKDEAG